MFTLANFLLLFLGTYTTIAQCQDSNEPHQPLWLVNYPQIFHSTNHSLGKLTSIAEDKSKLSTYETYVDKTVVTIDGFTDGENVDSLEHYFWGMTNGVAMELGALDGSPHTRSMTFDYEKQFGWKRILIDGNPQYREPLKKNSPEAFGAIAAICESHTTVHYASSEYVGGILEFMGQQFMKDYHKNIYESGNPPGDLKSIDWTNHKNVFTVDCMPLSHILHKAHITHINFFILDVEGGELEILKSINWDHTRFDVLCIETEPNNRPPRYAATVTEFLAARGYVNATEQVGRNIWFTRSDFVPHKRPGLHPNCFNGYEHSAYAERWWANRRTPAYQRCKMDYPS